MPRYEFSEGSSNKFWEITLSGKTFTTTYGKTGTAGQSASKSWPSEAEAKKQYDKLVAEKEKKGYELVGGSAKPTPKGAKTSSAAKAPAAPVETPRNPTLEKAIYDDPDNVAGYEAYGAWLKTQNDPLAELISIQTELSKNPKDKALKKKEKDFLTKQENALLGGLSKLKADDMLRASWRYGFIETLTLGSEEGDPEQEKPEDSYATLTKITASRFLHSLSFWAFDDDSGQPSYQKLLTQMEKLGIPPTLRHLGFDVKGYQVSWTDLGNLHKLYSQLQKLESLFLHVGHMNLGEITLPNLRKLEIQTGGFSKKNLKSVSEAKMPNLETLILYFGTDDYGCDCKAKDVKALLEGANFPKLKRLGLCNSEFADDLPELLAESKLLSKIRHLDLSCGTLADEGAQVLLDEKKAFSHLESLDLSQNYLSDIMRERLRIAFEHVNTEDQSGDNDDPEDRYVQIAE
jgi:predicted DNA-binding WGR domain protein